MKVCSGLWAHILFLIFAIFAATSKNLSQFFIVDLKGHQHVLRVNRLTIFFLSPTPTIQHIICIAQACRAIQALHAMYANEICHTSVHLLPIK
jgi:hypothetical protein